MSQNRPGTPMPDASSDESGDESSNSRNRNSEVDCYFKLRDKEARSTRRKADVVVGTLFQINDPQTWATVDPTRLEWTNERFAQLMRATRLAKEIAESDPYGKQHAHHDPKLAPDALLAKYGVEKVGLKFVARGKFEAADEKVQREVKSMVNDVVGRRVSVRSVLKTACIALTAHPAALAVFRAQGGLALVFLFVRTCADFESLASAYQVLCRVFAERRDASDSDAKAVTLALFRVLVEKRDGLKWPTQRGLRKQYRCLWMSLFAVACKEGALVSESRCRLTARNILMSELSVSKEKTDDPALVSIFGALSFIHSSARDTTVAVDVKAILNDTVLEVLDNCQVPPILEACVTFVKTTVIAVGKQVTQGQSSATPGCLRGFSMLKVFPEKMKKFFNVVTPLCAHGDPVIWTSSFAILTNFINLREFGEQIVEAKAVEVLVEILEGKRVVDKDFKNLLAPLRQICLHMHNTAHLKRAGVGQVLWDALVDYAARMPHGNRLAIMNCKTIFQLLMAHKSFISSQPYCPLIVASIIDRWLYEYMVAERLMRPRCDQMDVTPLVLAMEVLALHELRDYLSHVDVQRTLMFILRIDHRRLGNAFGVLARLAWTLFNEVSTNCERYAALIEQCVPSEVYLLLGDRREFLQSFYTATCTFGSGYLKKALMRNQSHISAESAAVAVPIIFKEKPARGESATWSYRAAMQEFMLKSGGLETLFDVVFRTSASYNQTKLRHRWYLAVNSLHVLAVRSGGIVSAVESPFPAAMVDGVSWNRTDMFDYWRCVRQETHSALHWQSCAAAEVPEVPLPLRDDPEGLDDAPAKWDDYASEQYYRLCPEVVAGIDRRLPVIPKNPPTAGGRRRYPSGSAADGVTWKRRRSDRSSESSSSDVEDDEADEGIDGSDTNGGGEPIVVSFADGETTVVAGDLAARSPYFEAMLARGSYLESVSGRVELGAVCSKAAFDAFLELAPPVGVHLGSAAAFLFETRLREIVSGDGDGYDVEQLLYFQDTCEYFMRRDLVALVRREFAKRLTTDARVFVEMFGVLEKRAAAGCPPFAFERPAVDDDPVPNPGPEPDPKAALVKVLLTGPMTLMQRAKTFQAVARSPDPLRTYVMDKAAELVRDAYAPEPNRHS